MKKKNNSWKKELGAKVLNYRRSAKYEGLYRHSEKKILYETYFIQLPLTLLAGLSPIALTLIIYWALSKIL